MNEITTVYTSLVIFGGVVVALYMLFLQTTRTVVAYKHVLEQYRVSNQRLEGERDFLRGELSKDRADLEKCEKLLEISNNDNAELRRKEEDWLKEKLSLLARVDYANNCYNAVAEQCGYKIKEADDLYNSVTALKCELTGVLDQVGMLEHDKQVLQDRHNNVLSKMSSQENDLNALRIAHYNAVDSNSALKRRIQLNAEENKDLIEKLNNQASVIAMLEQNVKEKTTLEGRLKTALEEYQAVLEERTALEIKANSYTQAHAKVMENCRQLADSNESLKQHVCKQAEELKTLQTGNSNLVTDRNNLLDIKGKLKQQVAVADMEVMNSRQRIAALEKQVAEKESMVKLVSHNRDAYQNRQGQFRNEIRELLDKMAD